MIIPQILADLTVGSGDGQIHIPQVSGSDADLKNILNTIYFWAGAIAVLIIIYAGVVFVTSKGDASRVAKAKNSIMGAVIGLVIVILAFVITNFIVGLF